MDKLLSTLRSCLPIFLFASLIGGCERDGVVNDVVPVTPVPNALISPVGHTFEWVATNPDKCRVRIGNPSMSQVVFDTLVSGEKLLLPIWLEADAPYRWEVTAGGGRYAADFRTEDVVFLQILSPGPASELPVTGGELRWRTTKSGECRLRLTDAGGAVVLDTLTAARSYRLHKVLTPNRDFHLEISQSGIHQGINLRSADVAVLSLISPAQGDIVPPCCGQLYRWTSGLPVSFRFRMGALTPAIQLLDTILVDTQLFLPGILLPGGDYFWEVEQNGLVIRNSFNVIPFEQLFPGAISGTTYHQSYNDNSGSSSYTSTGSITIQSVNSGAAVQVTNNFTWPQFVSVTGSALQYHIGDSQNFQTLDIDLVTGRISYVRRDGGHGWWHRAHFVNQ